jgi:hypothetical protein
MRIGKRRTRLVPVFQPDLLGCPTRLYQPIKPGWIEIDGQLAAVSLVVDNGRVTRIYAVAKPAQADSAGSPGRARQVGPRLYRELVDPPDALYGYNMYSW